MRTILFVLGLWLPTVVGAGNPVTRVDVASGSAGSSILIDVLANDSDRDGRAIWVTSASNVDCPGQVSLLAGAVLFEPDPGAESVDCSLDYEIHDGESFVPGSIELTLGEGRGLGGQITVSGNHFVRDGRPVYLAGYYPGLHTLTREPNVSIPPGQPCGDDPQNPPYFARLLGEMQARNLNLLRVVMTEFSATGDREGRIHPYEQDPNDCCTATPTEATWSPMNRFDLDRFNPDFFAYWQRVAACADEKDVVLQIAFFETRLTWGWERALHPPSGIVLNNGRKFSYLASMNNVNGVAVDERNGPQQWFTDSTAIFHQGRFVREAVRALGGYDNVIFELANEPPRRGNNTEDGSPLTDQELTHWLDTMEQVVRDEEAANGHRNHLVMPLDLVEHRDVPGHDTPGRGSNFADIYERMVSGWPSSPSPRIADNDCCFEPGSIDERRKKAWTSLLGGAHPLLFEFGADESYYSLVNNDRGSLDAMSQVGFTRALLERHNVAYDQLRPEPGLVADESTGANIWAFAESGQAYILYFLNGGSARVLNLPAFRHAEWLDPRTGQYQVAADTDGVFTAPSGDDWVLYVGASTPPTTERRPYGGTAASIPGRIEIERFDELVDDTGAVLDGQNQTYFDTTESNHGLPPFRPDERVDAQTLSGGRVVVNFVDDDEWLEYTVDIERAGAYALSVEYATVSGGTAGTVRLQMPAGSTDVSLTLPDSGGVWVEAHRFEGLTLPVGRHVLRLSMTDAQFHLDSLTLTALDRVRRPWNDTARQLPGIVEAEFFDTGNPGEAFFDTDLENLGSTVLRQDGWVDLSAVGDGHVIAWVRDGEWLEYTAELDGQAGSFRAGVRYATLAAAQGDGGMTLQILSSGSVEATVPILLPDNRPGQGQAGPYEKVWVEGISLAPGPKSLRLTIDGGRFALDHFEIQPEDGDTGDWGCGLAVPSPPTHNGTCSQPYAGVHDYEVVRGGSVTILRSDLLSQAIPSGEVEMACEPSGGPGIPGAVLDATDDAFIYHSPQDADGIDVVTYRIRSTCDPNLEASGVIRLLPLEAAPVPVDDTVTMPTSAPEIRIPHGYLLSNDQGAGLRFTGVVSSPSAGTLEFGVGYLRYFPNGSSIVDSFTYSIEDRNGTAGTRDGTVIITRSDSGDRPVANPDAFVMAQRTTSGAPARLDIGFPILLDNDGAAQGSELTVARPVHTPPQHGTLTESTHAWRYLAPETDVRTDVFRYQVEELGFLSDSAPVTLQLVPAPVGVADDLRTAFATPLTLPRSLLLSNDLAFGSSLSLVPGSLTEPAHGRLVPAGIGSELRYVPDEGFSGVDTFTYVAANPLDGLGNSWDGRTGAVTVSITVEPPDAFALDDTLRIPAGASSVELPLTRLFANDVPADELEVVTWTQPSYGTLELFGDIFIYILTDPDVAFQSDSFEYSVRRRNGNPNVIDTALVRIEPEADCTPLLVDDFESDLGSWDRIVEVGGSVQLSGRSAMDGLQGLEILLDPSGRAYVESEVVRDATDLSLSMRFDPASLTMAAGSAHDILTGSGLTLTMRREADGYSLRLITSDDGGNLRNSGFVPIVDGPQSMTLMIRSGSGPEANDGEMSWWIDGSLRARFGGLNNDRRRADRLRIGAVQGVDAGTSGSLFFDGFKICGGPDNRNLYVVDDGESGALDVWSSAVGDVRATSDAALEGSLGLSFDLMSGASYLVDRSPSRETHHRASFLLDDSALTMAPDDLFFLSSGQGSGWTYSLRLRATVQGRELSMMAMQDSGTWSGTAWVPLTSSSPMRIDLEWRAASAPGIADGLVRFWIDDALAAEKLQLDNDRRFLEEWHVGGTFGLDAGTSGVLAIDDVVTWQGDWALPFFLVDDFETGILDRWSGSVQAAGTVAVSPAAAQSGSYGLEIDLADNGSTQAYVFDNRLDDAQRFAMSFRLDPQQLVVPHGQNFWLAEGNRPDMPVLGLRIRNDFNRLSLSVLAMKDDGTWGGTAWAQLPNSFQPVGVTVLWRASRSDSADDGYVFLYLDDQLVAGATGLDSDQQSLNELRLGATRGLDAGTNGKIAMDDFVAWAMREAP